MTIRFVWADGQLGFASGYGKLHHHDILKKMVDEGQLQEKPQNYAAGNFTSDDFHGPAFDQIRIIWQNGKHPTTEELRYLIQQELQRTSREAMYQRLAAGTEDTEPTGENVGFLRDPHDELYPPLFRGEKKIPEDARQALKDHVLVPLSKEFTDPDKFIYFTIYGSGISYNWDEGGDLDLQLWVDIEKYSATTDDPLTIDDLLAGIRRIVQTVNFPTFAELGLEAPPDAKEDTTSAMMIQYYPKPGKGTKDENLASQPYACYDLETDEWLVEPKPMRPDFYGDEFLLLMPKAKDIALQAEALLGEYQRNILNWQFWFSLYNRYQKSKYRDEYREAMQNAQQEKEGIKNLFEGVFGGRAEAYSPEGKGIYDERDIVQKLLEVWGTFQDLKHFARAPLPWEEQELPAPPKVISGWKIEAVLQGLPENAIGEHPELQNIAEEYMYHQGLPYSPPQTYRRVDPSVATQIAQAYEDAEHKPDDQQVKASYDAMKRETLAQYEWLVHHGYQFEFYPEGSDPYPQGPRQALEDLHQNKHLYVYPTEAGFGTEQTETNHPLLEDSGIEWNGKPVTYNDIFRAVHDVFGHGKEGVGFRWDGEENAWRQHSAMYSDLARPAMTAETRGQNSWVNFGPHGEHNRGANQETTIYAPQKATVLPDWVNTHGVHDAHVAGAMDSPEHRDPGGWSGIEQKAQRLRDSGQVQVNLNTQNHVVGVVKGDHGTYNTEIWRDDPNSGTITLWNCDCPWSQYSWGRTRQWKKYEGRPCAHTLALYWTALTTPLQDENQQTIPGTETPGNLDLPNALQQTVQQPQAPPVSVPQPQNQAEQMTIGFPGAFSKWRKEGMFLNGDYVRTNVKIDGYDDRGAYYVVPRNMVGEVLWSDDEETIVIFSIESGPLGPHNVKSTAPTEVFTLVPRTRGTAPRRRR